MKRSGAGSNRDRADLGGLHARPEAIADAEAQLGPRSGGNSRGDQHTLRERDAHADEGAIDIDARDDAGEDRPRRGMGLLAGQGNGLGREGEGDAR